MIETLCTGSIRRIQTAIRFYADLNLIRIQQKKKCKYTFMYRFVYTHITNSLIHVWPMFLVCCITVLGHQRWKYYWESMFGFPHSLKFLAMCLTQLINSYRSGTTREWVNDGNDFWVCCSFKYQRTQIKGPLCHFFGGSIDT